MKLRMTIFDKKIFAGMKYNKFGEKLVNWYNENKRDLPWRKTKNPYYIWISEIILQQTRVAQGYNYYLNFISKFPTIESLASADENEVLKIWEGLGYYSRARNMHFASKTVVNELKSEFPNTFSEIIKLKGIGSYTAAAISSICFNEKVAVVDGNVIRVVARYLALNEPVEKIKKQIENFANENMQENAGDYNQAMMELGAIICTPQNPKCTECVLADSCKAKAQNLTNVLPLKTEALKKRKRYFHYIFIVSNSEIIIRKRSKNDIWKGLYEPYLIENESELSKLEIEKILSEKFNQKIELKNQKKLKHILSHQEINASFYVANVENINTIDNNYICVKFDEIKNYAFSKMVNKIFEQSWKN